MAMSETSTTTIRIIFYRHYPGAVGLLQSTVVVVLRKRGRTSPYDTVGLLQYLKAKPVQKYHHEPEWIRVIYDARGKGKSIYKTVKFIYRQESAQSIWLCYPVIKPAWSSH